MLASGAVYAFHFIASRTLGVVHYGTLASILAAVTLLTVLAGVGATVVARLAAEYQMAGEQGRIHRLFVLVLRTCGGAVAFCAVVSLVLHAQIAAFLHIAESTYVVSGAVLGALAFSAALLRGLLQGTQRFTAFSLSFTLENVGRALLGVCAVFLGYGLIGALVAQIAAEGAAIAYTIFGMRDTFTVPALRLRIDLRRLILTSGSIAVATICLAMLSYFDVILAKHYLSPQEAGLYGFAVLPGRTLSAIVSFLPVLILPKATAAAATGRRGHSMFWVSVAAATALLAVMVLVFYLMPLTLVRWTGGERFIACAPLIFPYGVATALFALAGIAASYKIGRHRFDFVAPLVLTVAGEICGIAFFHGTASQVVDVVLVTNAAALAACMFRVTAPAG